MKAFNHEHKYLFMHIRAQPPHKGFRLRTMIQSLCNWPQLNEPFWNQSQYFETIAAYFVPSNSLQCWWIT